MLRHNSDGLKHLANGPPASSGLPAIDVRLEHLIGYALATIEREFILQTLIHHHGNRTKSADVLGISVRSLRDRLRTYRSHGEIVPELGSSYLDQSVQLNLPHCFSLNRDQINGDSMKCGRKKVV